MQVFGGAAAAVRSSALGLGSEGHREWTNEFRVESQTHAEEDRNRADRPATSAWRVHRAGRRDLTPPGVCSDDGGRRPWASRRSCLGRGAPPVSAPGSPSVPGEKGTGIGAGGSAEDGRSVNQALAPLMLNLGVRDVVTSRVGATVELTTA